MPPARIIQVQLPLKAFPLVCLIITSGEALQATSKKYNFDVRQKETQYIEINVEICPAMTPLAHIIERQCLFRKNLAYHIYGCSNFGWTESLKYQFTLQKTFQILSDYRQKARPVASRTFANYYAIR